MCVTFLFLELITDHFEISERNLFITLSRIKLGLKEQFLADHFGLHQSTVSRIFTKTVPILAQILKRFVFLPPKEEIQANMPAAFKNNFSRMYLKVSAMFNVRKIFLWFSKKIYWLCSTFTFHDFWLKTTENNLKEDVICM